MKLKPLDDTELTDYVVQLLHKHDVNTLREFLDADYAKLTKISNLTESTIANIKKKLLDIYAPKPVLLSHYYKNVLKPNSTVYRTGIDELDKLLHEVPFSTGNVWEICGFANVGKTQLCHTIVLNIVTQHKCEALYVDTKTDFCGKRIRQMLRCRDVDKAECGRIMCRIKVERTFTLTGVIDILEQLEQALLSDKASHYNGIKVIVIDALPAVCFLMRDKSNRLDTQLLVKLGNLIWKLATRHLIAFLLVNLTLACEINSKEDELSLAEEDDGCVASDEEYSQPMLSAETQVKPTLGVYWLSVPHLRLSLHVQSDATMENNALRVIKVLQSCYSRSDDLAYICITDSGVA